MTDRYGIWMKDTQCWAGLGFGFEFAPFCLAREAAEAHCAQTPGVEAREINEVNVLTGLPYPPGTEKFASVHRSDDGTLTVAFDESAIRAHFEVGSMVFSDGQTPRFEPDVKRS